MDSILEVIRGPHRGSKFAACYFYSNKTISSKIDIEFVMKHYLFGNLHGTHLVQYITPQVIEILAE